MAGYDVAKAAGYRTKIELVGFNEVKKTLRKLGKETEELKPTMVRIGKIVEMAASAEAPVQTGALKNSLRSGATKKDAKVSAGNNRKSRGAVPYFYPIHFGWPLRNIEPNMFMYRGMNKARPKVQQIMDKKLRQLARKYSAPKYFQKRFLD